MGLGLTEDLGCRHCCLKDCLPFSLYLCFSLDMEREGGGGRTACGSPGVSILLASWPCPAVDPMLSSWH